MNMPPIVKTLLLINVVAYIIDLVMPMSHIFGLYYVMHPEFHAYQFVTYMFMHGGLSHLFFNMFALWMFGRVMEQTWGAQRFLIYYLVCGIGAGVVQELGQLFGLINPWSMTIGASGAVYGILLAFGMTYPNERLFIIPIPFPIKAKYFVAFYAAIELFEGMSANDGVAHFAHLGGMLFGFILIMYWRNKVRQQRFGKGNFWGSSSSTTDYYGGTYGSYDKGESVLDKIKSLFAGKKKKPKMTINYGGGTTSNERQKDYEYNARKKQDNEEIDRILDKVRKDGYANLTTEEKNKLFNASKQ
ncbi:MAG: rhomboid family intramembrane serine protease [Bacteroidaceae bacterium]|nr:rhomboid family intramembrane serine protease [Bacteroidaceae bacterium]